MSDIVNGLGRATAYGALGLVLLVLGIVLVDLLTPGKLGRQIWEERNRNAAPVLSSALLGIGGIVFTSIWTTYEDFGKGLVMTAVAFLVVDLITPGRLGDGVLQPRGVRRHFGLHRLTPLARLPLDASADIESGRHPERA